MLFFTQTLKRPDSITAELSHSGTVISLSTTFIQIWDKLKSENLRKITTLFDSMIMYSSSVYFVVKQHKVSGIDTTHNDWGIVVCIFLGYGGMLQNPYSFLIQNPWW
mgnify:CR=1 FL=1